jgi:hypothetical protein
LPKRRSHVCNGRSRLETLPQRWRRLHPQDHALEVKPDTSTTNAKRHLIFHTTQGSVPQGCRSLEAAASTCHFSTTPCAVNQDHNLLGPSPRHATARSRAAMPHKPTTCSPSYSVKPAADHNHHTNSSGAAALA